MKSDTVALIQRALAGDEAAFTSLVSKYEKQVHAYALREIGDFHIAEDITQETFLEVHQKLETLKAPEKFSTWLYAIVKNLVSLGTEKIGFYLNRWKRSISQK